MITLAENMRRNSYHNNYPKDVALAIQAVGALQRQINKREKNGKEQDRAKANGDLLGMSGLFNVELEAGSDTKIVAFGIRADNDQDAIARAKQKLITEHPQYKGYPFGKSKAHKVSG